MDLASSSITEVALPFGQGSPEEEQTPSESGSAVGEQGGGPLQLLIRAASLLNAQQFELPNEMACPIQLPGSSKRVRTSGRGSKRPAPHELDGGLVPLPAKVCFQCRRSCRWAPLIQCDYCPLLFHADCLDYPLATLPTTRWMCPNHAENLLEEKLLTSVSLTERVRLWDRYTGRLSQDAVKLEFLAKAHRESPSFRIKREHKRKLRAKVPPAVRAHYRHPPPMPPVLRLPPEALKEPTSSGPTLEEQEEWLAGVVALQTSIAKHLARHRPAVLNGPSLHSDPARKEDTWPKSEPGSPCPPKTPHRPQVVTVHAGKAVSKNGPSSLSSSPAIVGLNSNLQSYIDGFGEVELNKLDERLVRILAWQRLQQLLPSRKAPPVNGLLRSPSPGAAEVRARAVVCPVAGRGPSVPMPYRTLTIGSGADMDVCLTNFGHCNFVSSKHACIFYDEMSKHYELLNYSEHGTTVDNVLYSCDFSDKRTPLPPSSPAVAALRGRLSAASAATIPSPTSHTTRSHTTSASPPQSRRPCSCKASSSSLIGGGGAGWEGTALLHHGSHIKLGCFQFVFSVTEESRWT